MQATSKTQCHHQNSLNNLPWFKQAYWFFIIIIACSFGVSAQTVQEDQPPFYKISWQNQHGYLLGSIHVGQASFYPMAEQIEQAFLQSDALVIEADVEQADTMALLTQYGKAAPELAAKTSNVTADYCQKVQSFCDAIAPYAPWLQAAQISMMRFASLGYVADQGVDVTFAKKRGNKPLLELESVAFQFELISSFSEKTQLQMVDEAVNASDADMVELISVWRNGDQQKLAAIMEQQAGEADELLTKLLWQRNHTMSDKMLTMMQQHSAQQLFFIVGAGHVVGQQNIPQLLRQQGATVTDCWQNSCR
ncbi:TraB/GumN family protein [Shewanella gaetbuli]|uniref:TraB/GumN family protein n=1 Tax=Shewanella gaetbuli TaxID=220752 RepID=A0A9X1ZKJ3_9GAMM|nr:TraB/GumN family protein [Shewanella gaetbuli]MCL1141175.1 TraB/GumN family protein [Shewanella gaetbuli]